MSYTISTIYNIMVSLISTNMGILCKTSSMSFEAIPAIGFDKPTISPPDVISNNLQLELEIPVRIVNEGDESQANLVLTDIYEDFTGQIRSNLYNSLATNGIKCSLIEVGQFIPMVVAPDSQMVGLDGTIKLIIEV